MGIHHQLHLGSYVECTYRKESRDVPVFGCTNTACKSHPKTSQQSAQGKFCSECASPNGAVQIKVTSHTSYYDIVGDMLFEINAESDDVLYLAPNVRRPGDPRPHLRREEEAHIDLTGVNQTEEMTWFMRAFAPELELLRAAYDNVTVKWGFHHYFN